MEYYDSNRRWPHNGLSNYINVIKITCRRQKVYYTIRYNGYDDVTQE